MTDVAEVRRQPELKRAIGPKLLLFFVIGDILGTGIYALTGSVAGKIGGALWIPFLLAFVVAYLTAFSYLELVGKYPRAAGAALYTHKAFGIDFLTFMVTFTVMASGVTSAATASKAFGDTYLRQFIELPTWAVAAVFILGLALINFRGVGESVKANVVLTCIERVEPPRIFPRAMLIGMAVAALIYIAVAVLSSMLVPAADLAAAKSSALFRVLEAGAPGFPLGVFAAIGLFAVVNSALINMLMASRLLYGMSNERVLPAIFGRVHPSRRTPWFSIIFTSVIALILVTTVDITLLGGTTALLLLGVFTIVNIAVLVLRRDPVDHPHFRAPSWTPWVGIVFCGFLASPLSGRPLQEFAIAGVLLVVGAILWVVNRLFVGRVEVDASRLGKS
jgi:APA family basic amino acid/polyamine antiporter